MLWQAEHRVPRRRRLVSFAVIGSVFGALLLALGLVARGDSASAPMRIPVISYHGVTADQAVGHGAADPRFFDVRLSAFREQMEYLRDAGYRSITPKQYERWLYGKDVSLPAKPILITFDDVQSSLQLATPVLKQTGFATTVYVVSGRYRFEVRNRDDLTAFKSGLDSSRFSR
jgi:hypothetical protein